MRNALVADATGTRVVDLRIERGRIASVEGARDSRAAVLDAEGRLVVPGLVETHLHLDKSRLGFGGEGASLAAAMAETRSAKASFDVEDVYRRAEATLAACIAQGTTRIRTQVEVDPVVGLRGFEAILELGRAYAWAVDLEVCVFAQDGLDGPEDVALLAEALEKGASVVGGAPYADRDPLGHLDQVFELARAFDVDVDLHLDLAEGDEGMLLEAVCERTDELGYGGRVVVGHVTQLSYAPPERYDALCRQVAASGVAVTVLPATDLYLTGRKATHAKPRGVLPLAGLLDAGVACSVATNNVRNAFTPYGDGSLVRMANLYANVCHVAGEKGLASCLELVTSQAARVIGVRDYGIAEGAPADLVLLDADSPAGAIAGLAAPLWGMKSGRLTFSREPSRLHVPGAI